MQSFLQRASGLVAAVLLAILLVGCDRTPKPPLVGDPAPLFTVSDSDRTVALADLRGKPVVLNFWATWCPPCVDEMPSLVALQHRFQGEVTVLAVSVDVDESAYRDFLVRHQIDLLTVRDAALKSNTLYGTIRFPETYIIDAKGVLRRKFVGPVDWMRPDVVSYLAQIASEGAAGPTEQASAGAANSR